MISTPIYAYSAETPRTTASLTRAVTPPTYYQSRNVTPLKLPPDPPQHYWPARPVTPPAVAPWTPRQTPQTPTWTPYEPFHRPVTPPPTITTSPNDGWVTVSTANMSPFMVLRIKALIELAAIPSFDDSEKIQTKCVTPIKAGCLKKRQPRDIQEMEMQSAAENYDARCVGLLNNLLDQSRQVRRPEAKAVLMEVNANFEREKHEIFARHDESASKLAFSPGATLICFDSSEKPRRIRENHAKHFSAFLLAQQEAQQRRLEEGSTL